MGTALTSDIPGYVTAIRFWKASNETGTHTGNLWTASGTLLATATFESETSSGWQQQNLSSPVPIDANTPYVVSVNTGNSFYVATPKGLLSPIIHQDLSSVVGNNGVLGSPGNFPSASFNHNSYFRDIVFTANISKTPTITWTTPAPVTYGTALGAAQLDATADVPGSFSYSPSAGTVLGAGTQNLSVTFTPTDMVHYTTASASVALTVNPQTT